MAEILIIIFIFLLLYYLHFLYTIFRGINTLKTIPLKYPDEFISVIIPFRNEEENILQSLHSIEGQDYPVDRYEVIYVNDSSEDNGRKLLQANIRSKNIYLIDSPFDLKNKGGKKHAVNFGIQNCKGGLIVTTDADCTHNPGWLKNLVKYFDESTAMVAGAVDLLNTKENLFEKIQRLEFAGLITAGAGLISAGSPIICNAANLAYRKDIYLQLGGFRDNLHLSSGDDELLMQKIYRETPYKIKFCSDKEAVVKTHPAKNLNYFIHQRRRWASKGFYYKNWGITIRLLLIFLFYLGLMLQMILGFIYPQYLFSFFVSFIIKIAAEYFIMKRSSGLLFDKKLLQNFILTEILHIPYIIFTAISGTFRGFSWKNRQLKR
jgi:cellulose synthase/poly-beta-1,6-N-acetylglucosamine synthase-like glycosyltransferase